MSTNCNNSVNDALIAKLIADFEKHKSEIHDALARQTSNIADTIGRIDANINTAVADTLHDMRVNGDFESLVNGIVVPIMNLASVRTEHLINVKEFGAEGNGICDDTVAIQSAIDYANEHGRQVFVPAGKYLISKTINLNGCSLVGEVGNIYSDGGSVIECITNDFTAISQGSTQVDDIMFTVENISIINANVGFEIIYSVNSTFKSLYATDCKTGFKIGKETAVGCMFCNFENLYTSNCDVGVSVLSKEYFNNNRFVNGFIHGDNVAMEIEVVGGYGAVGNVFENVEFKSNNGRGIVLNSCANTVFNSCYFECGGNAVRLEDYCTITLNNCTYGIYAPTNTYGDTNVIYTVGGGAITFNGGVVFLSDSYANTYFFGTGNDAVYGNIDVIKGVLKNGSATGFDFFAKPVKIHAGAATEQVITTGTVVAKVGMTTDVPFTYAKPFDTIPNVTIATMRGASGVANGLSYVFSERTKDGGVISISNSGSVDRSVSFSVYSKII